MVFNKQLVLAGAVLSMSLVGLAAQQKPAAAGDPVTVSFRVLTSSGSPVVDLTAADIVLKIGGRERAIHTFDRLRLGDAPAADRLIPPPFATNARPATGLRDTLLVIDDQSISPGEEKRIATSMEQYLAALGPSDRVGIAYVQDRGLNVLMTNDRDKLRAALKTLAGRATAAERSDDANCRTRRVIDALSSVSASVPQTGVPVTVMLFTTGVVPPATTTAMSRGGSSAPAPSACEVTTREFQDLERAVAGSAINLYVVAAALSPSSAMQQGIENLAGASGNPLMEIAKGGDSDMARVARENDAWYRVTFVPESNERTGNLQRIDIQTKRAGASAKVRSQLVIAKAAPSSQPANPKDMLREARLHRDLELRAAAYTSMEPGSDKVKVVVLVEPSLPGVTLKSAMIGLFDAQGKLTVQGTAEAANLTRSPATLAVLASPGKYRLRVAAADTENHGGSVDLDVDVSLMRAGSVQLGSLILGVADGGSFAGRLRFSTEPAAIGYLEVYGLPAGAQLSGQLEIAESPTGRALVTAGTKVLGDGTDGRRVILGGASIAELPPGDILFRMIVNVDGKPVGSVVRTLHKMSR